MQWRNSRQILSRLWLSGFLRPWFKHVTTFKRMAAIDPRGLVQLRHCSRLSSPKPYSQKRLRNPKPIGEDFWMCLVFLPITSFEAKKWLEVNFPSRGKVINFPSSRKNSFFSNPSFHGKTGHFKGKGKLYSRENYPWEGKFSLSGKSRPSSFGKNILPQKMFMVADPNRGVVSTACWRLKNCDPWENRAEILTNDQSAQKEGGKKTNQQQQNGYQKVT